jgi:hypothetical protein
MTLDNKINDLTGKIKEGRLTRRDFFKLGALVGAGALVNYACGNKNVSSPTDPTPPNTNNPVNIKLIYRNHTQGKYGEKTITKKPGEQFIVRARDIGGGNVDADRVAVRESNFGKLIKFTNNRDLVLNAPNTNKTYEVYGFNIASGADYELMDEQNARLYNGKHNFVVWRRDFDGQTGPEYIWEDVFEQLNNALIRPGGGIYGSIDRRPNANSGDFSYGYGIPPNGGIGCHGGDYIYVHPGGEDKSKIATGLSEAFEQICDVQNINGLPSRETICNYGSDRLNTIGRDLFTYVLVKE